MSDLLLRGPIWGGSSAPSPFTSVKSGAQRVADAHARYHAAVDEQRSFIVDSDSVAVAAANATKSALGTAKFINGFFNPLGSKVIASIWNARVATVSGTPGGPMFWNYFQATGITSAPTGTIRSGYLGAAAPNGLVALVNVVLATTPVLTTALIQLAALGGPAAIAAGAGNYDVFDDVSGAILVPPGFGIGIMALAAGTTHVVQSTIRGELLQEI